MFCRGAPQKWHRQIASVMSENAAGPGAYAGGLLPHIFLKIDGIKGDARSDNHNEEIELASWSWGETQSVFPSETRKSGGSVAMRDLQFTAVTSAASSQLLIHCATAKRLKSAVLTCEQDYKTGKHVYLTITFSNIVVSSYEIEGSAQQNQPMDRVTLKFTKMEFAYTPLKPDGNPGGNYTATWDLTVN
jgi:type VI secretion system secreted protein Hcp